MKNIYISLKIYNTYQVVIYFRIGLFSSILIKSENIIFDELNNFKNIPGYKCFFIYSYFFLIILITSISENKRK